MDIIFHFQANKTHFQKKGCAPSLILKVRIFGTRKWPIKTFRADAPYGCIILIDITLHIMKRRLTLSRHNEKESPFFNGRYTKGVPLLKKIVVNKRVRVGVLGAESVLVLNFDE